MTLEITLGCLLAAVLVGLALFFARAQFKTLASLRRQSGLAVDDRLYLRKQAIRRLLCCFLMVVFASMLAGWFFLEERLSRPLNEEELELRAKARPQELVHHRGKEQTLRVITVYWAAALIVLFAMLLLAAIDLMATARFGFRHYRQLEAEKKSIIEDEVARWRGRPS
ncbi:MAG: hypothetical protein FJ271_24230 [Planctomycetes bacterium]|nr:hypothetical protein [Planctomycetota bacterium]